MLARSHQLQSIFRLLKPFLHVQIWSQSVAVFQNHGVHSIRSNVQNPIKVPPSIPPQSKGKVSYKVITSCRTLTFWWMPKTQHWCNLRGTSVENSLHPGMRMAVLVPKMHPIPYSVYLAPVGCTKMIHYRYCVEVEKKRSRLSKLNDRPCPQLEIRAAPRPLPSFIPYSSKKSL